jgi:UDP-N-acetylmuramoyl-tripeptide--D-alanyl-D-alanine ligase
MTESSIRPEARAHSGLLLKALYPLGAVVPGLRRVPRGLRRAARRAVTGAGVKGHLRRCRNTRIVAITGSMGKTTTKDLLAEMLAPDGPTMKTRHNDNGVYGVPASLLLISPADRHAVIELGIQNQPGEMGWMAGMFRPDVAVLTSIGVDHLPAYGSREAIAREKRALLERVPRHGTVVVSADDDVALRTARGLACRVITAGWAADADVRLDTVSLAWPHGMDIELTAFGQPVAGRLALFGRHLAAPAALALAAASASGVAPEAALRHAASFRPGAGRMEPVPGPAGSLFIHDDFKSRVGTAMAAVRALGEIPADRRVAVLGEVQESEHDDDAYRPIAELLPERADLVVAVGRSAPPLSRLLSGSRIAGGVVSVERVEAAASALRSELAEGDVVLVHGSTSQHLERIHFLLDERRVGCRVRRCSLLWRCEECPHLTSRPPDSVILDA